jgi:hypothetical protein
MGAYVYMLECADGSLYVGITRHEDLASRVWQHETGALGGYTSTRRPVKLVWSVHFRPHHRSHRLRAAGQGLAAGKEARADPARLGEAAGVGQARGAKIGSLHFGGASFETQPSTAPQDEEVWVLQVRS